MCVAKLLFTIFYYQTGSQRCMQQLTAARSRARPILGFFRGWWRHQDHWQRRLDVTKQRPRGAHLNKALQDPKYRTRLCSHWENSKVSEEKGHVYLVRGPTHALLRTFFSGNLSPQNISSRSFHRSYTLSCRDFHLLFLQLAWQPPPLISTKQPQLTCLINTHTGYAVSNASARRR